MNPEVTTCERESNNGLEIVRVRHGGSTEAFLTLPSQQGEEPTSLLQRLYGYLENSPGLKVVRQDLFGVVEPEKEDQTSKLYRLDGSEWPSKWVRQGNGAGSPVSGLQVHALSGVSMQPIRLHGRTVGTIYEDDWGRYCVVGGLRPESAAYSRAAQTRQTFDRMEEALEVAGMSFANVYRTWFYLDHILDWYGEFNGVRNRFFKERGVYDRLVPASTGVGGSNSAGTAVVADLLAVEPKKGGVTLAAIPSPLQCPALEYGSSFSRAVELAVPGERRLLISGTASIAPEGMTLHVGDVGAQLSLTMEVVDAILKSRAMTWGDVTRGIAYFQNGADIPRFAGYCRSKGLPTFPVISVKNDICRDDLLFELEVDAIKVGETSPPSLG